MTNNLEMLAARFRDSEEFYRAAQTLWDEVWHRLDPTATRSWRSPWHEEVLGWFEGNPIFSAISAEQNLALRVIVHTPSEGTGGPIDYWFDSRELSNGKAVKELVIDCAISLPALLEAERLMGAWVAGRMEVVSPVQAVAKMSSVQLSSLRTRTRVAA